MARRIAGTCSILMDGQQFELSMDGVEYPLTDTKNETLMGITGVAGVKEMAQTPHLYFSTLMVPDFPYGKLRTAQNVTLTANFANGQVYHLGEAHLIDGPTGDGYEGKAELKFEGATHSWNK